MGEIVMVKLALIYLLGAAASLGILLLLPSLQYHGFLSFPLLDITFTFTLVVMVGAWILLWVVTRRSRLAHLVFLGAVSFNSIFRVFGLSGSMVILDHGAFAERMSVSEYFHLAVSGALDSNAWELFCLGACLVTVTPLLRRELPSATDQSGIARGALELHK